jgi:5-methyltetrahydrofolate--homocysteine methyltransferase
MSVPNTATSVSKTEQTLRRIARERILVLDGAMGTMIQELKLDEEGYRGARFDAWNREVRGNNDLLILTQPDAIAKSISRTIAPAPTSSRPTPSPRPRFAQADYGMQDIAYELNLEGARLARAAADLAQTEDGRPRFVAGALGPDQPHRLDLARRVEPRLPRHHVRPVARRLWRAGQGLIDGGARSPADRDDLRYAQRQGGDLRHQDACEARGVQLPVMISGTITDRSGGSFRARRRPRSGTRCGTRAVLDRAQLRARRQGDARAHRGDRARRRHAGLRYPNAGLPNEFGRYDESPEYMGELLASSRASGLVNVVGGCCGTTPGHISAIARAVEGKAPRQVPEVPRLLRLSASRPSRSRPRSHS